MQKSNSTHLSFEVSVDPLTLPAKKPQHLEMRFSSERSRQNSSEVEVDHRRRAFLEERKARLSKRQAHIKKKLLAHRDKQRHVYEQKAVQLAHIMTAAHKNRTHFLHLREKACAGHMQHVKKVAEQHYRRMAEQSAKIQAQLNEKHSLVARRRQKLLSIPRSRLMETDLCSSEDLIDVASARLEAGMALQQWWRRYKFAPLVGEYKKLGLTLKSSKKMRFEVLMRKMQSKLVMNTTSSLLKQIKKARGTDAKVIPGWKAPSRVYLTCYMLIAHPKEIMPNVGPQEEALQKSAISAVEATESWLNGYTSSQANELLQNAIEALDTYLEAFDAWKMQDTTALIEGLVSHWINLERLWMTVRNQPDVDTNWRPKIEQQQKDIHAKIMKLGPQAISRLEQVQKELNQELKEEEEANEAAIAESTSSSSSSSSEDGPSASILSTSPERFPQYSHRTASHKDSVNSTRTPSRQGTQDILSKGKQVVEPQSEEEEQKTVKFMPQEQKFGDFLGGFGQAMTNEFLAHEIILDPDFKLKPHEKNPMEEKIEMIAKKAFFDAVREEFNQGKYEKFFVALISDIRDSLKAMVSEKSKIAVEIDDILDIELMKQELSHNTLNVQQRMQWIVSKMLQLCAPMRDSAIREILQFADVTSQFERIMEMLDNMKMDLANFRIQSLKPALKMQAVEYETKKFKEALEAKQASLERTKTWLSRYTDTLEKVASSRNPENIQIPENRVKFIDIFHEAYLGLIFSNEAVSPQTIPETFMMDAKRIFDFQNKIQTLTIISALLMLMKNVVPELREDASAKKLKDALLVLLKENDITLDHLTAQLIATLKQHTSRNSKNPSTDFEKQESVIKSIVSKTLSPKDPVYSLINRRIQSAVKVHVVNGTFKKESLANAGLYHVTAELESISYKIALLASHNKKVYGSWYDEILQSLSQE